MNRSLNKKQLCSLGIRDFLVLSSKSETSRIHIMFKCESRGTWSLFCLHGEQGGKRAHRKLSICHRQEMQHDIKGLSLNYSLNLFILWPITHYNWPNDKWNKLYPIFYAFGFNAIMCRCLNRNYIYRCKAMAIILVCTRGNACFYMWASLSLGNFLRLNL